MRRSSGASLVDMIEQGLSGLGLGGNVSLLGIGRPQDQLGTKPDILDMFRLEHPESDQTKIVVEIDDKNFVTKRHGIVAKHIVYADLPETVKDALQRRRQFMDHVDKASEIQAIKADQQETLKANAAGFEDALQTVLYNMVGDEAMELGADVTLKLDTSTTDNFHVSDGNKYYGPIITPDQAKDVKAIETQITAAQDQATILEWEIEIAETKAEKNHEAAAKMYELAASLLTQHLGAQEHEVLLIHAAMNNDSTDGIFQVVFGIDEKLGEYPISHLPEGLLEKINEPIMDIKQATTADENLGEMVDSAVKGAVPEEVVQTSHAQD